jgi:3-deoxy-D-manno-octulosonic-acid transferase
LAPALLARRLQRGKEVAARLSERRGEATLARPRGRLVWLHGASVGELTAGISLIDAIRARGFNVLSTSGTVTSASVGAERLPAGVIHQFVPLDTPSYVARFLDHWRPDFAMLMESDLWPNLVMGCEQRGVPLVLVNGRISERAWRRWSYAPSTIARLLHCFDLCLAQSPTYAERLSALGAAHVVVTGNLKLDVAVPPADEAKLGALKAAIDRRTVVLAASTHAGEEAQCIEVHRRLRSSFPQLLTIIVPRHPERGPGIVEIAKANGLGAAARSRGALPDATVDVYVADTMGELGLFYRVAPIVFVGGSLVGHGGQNPIEPVKLGAAVLHGPNVWNFAEVYDALDRARGAELVTDIGRLSVRIGAWLTDENERLAVAKTARQTVDSLGGALDRTLAALEPYFMQMRLGQPDGHA